MTATVIDIEADGLLDTVSTLWVFVGKELFSDSVVEYIGIKEIKKEVPKYLSNYKSIIGHNLLGYDIELLKRFLEYKEGTHIYVDTLVLSNLLYPDRVGGHSIEAWAERFGEKKVEQESWDVFDPNMVARCHKDVEICERVYKRVMWEMEQ